MAPLANEWSHMLPWSALDDETAAGVRSQLEELARKHRGRDDASASKIVDGWIASGEAGALPGGKAALALRWPRFDQGTDSVTKIHPAEYSTPLWFDLNGPRLQLERRALEEQEQARRHAIEMGKLEAREKKQRAREGELRGRQARWRTTPAIERALLRGHSDPLVARVFAELHRALRAEPAEVQEQPPRCAWDALGITPNPEYGES